jgi:hypothetical protein
VKDRGDARRGLNISNTEAVKNIDVKFAVIISLRAWYVRNEEERGWSV